MRAVLALLLAWLATASPARAEEPPAELSTFQKLDGIFAATFVGPLASVLFFDVVFWDDTLPPEAAVGKDLDGPDGRERVTGVEGAGTRRQRLLNLPLDAQPIFDAPFRTHLGKLEAVLETVEEQRADGPVPVLLGRLAAQPVDLAALGLEPAPADAPEDERVVRTDALAPFPVRVDRSTATTLAVDVALPPNVVPIDKGMVVSIPTGGRAEVLEVLDDGILALDQAARVEPTPIPNPEQTNAPLVVCWLVLGAVFFTIRMSFVNLRAFRHAIEITLGRYDHPEAEGEISHFQALSSALSATVGLGNIAGVAIAVATGGPGAVFWMVIAGFLGMSSKFTECTLGQMYRIRKPDGSVSGGPMHYLDKGLAELGMGPLGKVLAVVFALMCIGGSLGGGNMFQARESRAAVVGVLTDFGLATPSTEPMIAIAYGAVLAFVVGLVIIGGIKRIGLAAGFIVPIMCGLYVLAGCFILVVNASHVPGALVHIVTEAFTPQAGMGGMLGVLMTGFRRAAFSNEAGVGSASIAHSAATTAIPVREGIVALLEPFIDTVVVCTMSGLVVVVTDAYKMGAAQGGSVITAAAFGSVVSWFPVVLSVAVLLFAFSTMISWSYYGERCATWLFGDRVRMPYRVLFLLCVFLGANFELGSVLDFSDLMVLGMAFPNILGAVLLSNKVKAAFDDYWARLAAGEFVPSR